MSDSEEEYEVDTITQARVQGRNANKQWYYLVKWKNYDAKHNTWEPIESFEGSDHFIHGFWEKVRDKRDWRDISLFDHDETIYPTGPPRRIKKSTAKAVQSSKPQSKGKAAATSSASRPKPESKKHPAPPTSKGPPKRKFAEIEVEDVEDERNGLSSETEVRSIIEEPARRGRPRRRMDDEQPPVASLKSSRAKSRQSRTAVVDEDDDVIEVPPPPKSRKGTTARPANLPPRSRKTKKAEAEKVERSPRTRKVSSSQAPLPNSSRGRASASPSKRSKRQKAAAEEKESSPDEILLDDKDPIPGSPIKVVRSASNNATPAKDANAGPTPMQIDPDTGAEGDVEDEAMQIEAPPVDDDILEVPSSDILEQPMTPGAEQEHEKQIEDDEPAVPAPKLPAHRARAANPRVKMVDDNVKADGPRGISTKARISQRINDSNTEAVPSSTTRVKSTGKAHGESSSTAGKKKSSKPGPGRSSSGLQLTMGSTSLLTVVKKGALQTLRKLNPYSRAQADEEEAPVSEAESEEVPTAEELLKMGGYSKEDAIELSDYEDADAEGDLDPFVHGRGHARSSKATEVQAKGGVEESLPAEAQTGESGMPAGEADDINTPVAEESVEQAHTHDAKGVEDENNVEVTTSGTIVNPPDAAIGRKPSTADLAAWKQTTIFGPLGVGRDGPVSPILPGVDAPQPQAGTADHGFSIILTSAKHLPVVLKDVHAPKSGAMQPLGAVTVNTNADAPGCFYKSPHASALIDAFRVEGSCARVVKDEGMDAAQKEYFEQFVARLKEGDLYLATINSHTLAFCASENAPTATKLGMSPNLIGLGDNVLVAEVEISDEGAWCDAVMNADPGGW